MTQKQRKNQMKKELMEAFERDLNDLISDFISDFGLNFKAEDASTSSPVVRWLDFTTRYVEPKNREIFYSKKFPKALNEEVERNLKKIEEIIKIGGDINPYQSKGLIIHNDTSGSKRQKRTDLLFADWGIHHIHISNPPANAEYFSPRSEWLF